MEQFFLQKKAVFLGTACLILVMRIKGWNVPLGTQSR
jgi:hypothetical protein